MAEQKADDKVNKDRVILITGASKGFGFRAANGLAKEGYKVYGGSRSKPKDEFTFNWVELDVSKEDQIKSVVDEIVKKEGKIDVLINNAGINLPAQTVQNTPLSEFRRIMEINYFGLIAITQAVIPVFLEKNNKSGHIINVSSCISLVGLPFFGAYTATKAALDRLTESLYNELSCTDIKVQIISPGPSNTEFDKDFISKIKEQDKVYDAIIPNFLTNGQEMRKHHNVPPQDVADTIIKMVNKADDAKDFRVYPGHSLNQVKALNANFNNNYSQNVNFGAYALRKPEPKPESK